MSDRVMNQLLAEDDDRSQQQVRAAVQQAIQVKQLGQSSKGAEGMEGGA